MARFWIPAKAWVFDSGRVIIPAKVGVFVNSGQPRPALAIWPGFSRYLRVPLGAPILICLLKKGTYLSWLTHILCIQIGDDQGDFFGIDFIVYSHRAHHYANFAPNLSKIGQVELMWHFDVWWFILFFLDSFGDSYYSFLLNNKKPTFPKTPWTPLPLTKHEY